MVFNPLQKDQLSLRRVYLTDLIVFILIIVVPDDQLAVVAHLGCLHVGMVSSKEDYTKDIRRIVNTGKKDNFDILTKFFPMLPIYYFSISL